MLTEDATLTRIAEVFDHFAGLSETEIAHIFHALDTAPQAHSWAYVKGIDLAKGQLLKPLTLAEACRWPSYPPDFNQIMAGLNFAAGIVA